MEGQRARGHMLPARQSPLDLAATGERHKQESGQAVSESRKHPLPSPDLDDGCRGDRLERPFKLPLYPPPPAYAQTHDASSKSLAFAHPQDKTELAPIQFASSAAALPKNDDRRILQHHQHNSNHSSSNTHNFHSLPSLSSLTFKSPNPASESDFSPPAPPPVTHWPSLNPLTAYYAPSHAADAEPLRMDVDTSSSSGASVSTVASPDRYYDGNISSVSLDDPDVRMAAEALSGLRADFHSPKNEPSPAPGSPQSLDTLLQPQPLLSLLTTSHPFLATTIETATSAYNNSKNYSPRFKTSAEYVEGYVIPITNTIGTVGRKTGVEGSVRWFLQRRQSHGAGVQSRAQFSNKRRRVQGRDDGRFRDTSPEPASGTQTPRASVENFRERRLSSASTVDTLPAYDDEGRAPPYDMQSDDANNPGRSGQAWPSRFIISTSALSIAMSEESLRSLKYCLMWLKCANIHVSSLLNKIKSAMDEHERRRREAAQSGDHPMEGDSDRHNFTAKIGALKKELLRTLEDAILTVGKYAGGALPENASDLVREHLTSLPRRFHLANQRPAAAESEETDLEEGRGDQDREAKQNAQLMITLAREGLDMMAQVSDVLDGTITSAEEWCEKVGRRKKEEKEELMGSHQSTSSYPTGELMKSEYS